MNERIKQLAEQAHKYAANDPRANITVSYVSIFEEKFAELVRQDEREACAKLCEGLHDCEPEPRPDDCATAIRARGTE
jgi:hypothetical protein